MALSPNRPPGYGTPLLIAGGNPESGREIVLHHPRAGYVRCHVVGGVGGTGGPGGTAGPNLTSVGSRLTPEKLVESLIQPGAVLAAGFGSVTAMPVIPSTCRPAKSAM